MSYRRIHLSDADRSPVVVPGGAAPTEALVEQTETPEEQNPSDEIRQAIRKALAVANSTIRVLPLHLDEVTVVEHFFMKRNPANQISPALLIKGVTYHDGKIKGMPSEKVNVDRQRLEISRVKDFTLSEVQNVILTEWCVFEGADQDPRLTMGKRQRGSSLSLREQEARPKGFQQSVSHTVFSRKPAQLEEYIAQLNRR